MPQYRIRHLTQYNYEEPVSVCHNMAHLLPRQSPHHFWTFAEVDIHPAPAVRSERLDYFGNRLTLFAMQEPHKQLDVLARSIVAMDPVTSAGNLFGGLAWETVRDQLANAPRGDLLDAFQFVFESPFIRLSPEVRAYAEPSFFPGRPLVEAVLDLTHRLHHDFIYDTSATDVATTLPEVLQARRGVCQDFAHLQIGCLRAMGLAARYVSGYLMTTPPPGKQKLVGADASHAWISVYVPQSGWLDFDPTNDCVPTDRHITIAWGRDFGDVSPLRGVILGGGRHVVEVSVDVSQL